MSTEVLVIGGGLAGSAAAITLAQQDCDVTLVEREAAPHHKVCGEFLSQEALFYLRALGVEPERLGAVPIRAVRLAGSERTIEARLPFAAMSLTRRLLDEELLRCAVASGVKVLRGRSVEALTREGRSWKAMLPNHGVITAQAVFLATGKHDLRGHARPAGKQPGMIAFKMYWRLSAAQTAELDEHVELVLYRGGYAGLQPVEDGAANLCCLIEAREFQRLGGRWANMLEAMRQQSPHLNARLEGAEPLMERPLAIASLPYGFVRKDAAGLWHLGDQAAVIPSFTGDGMSLALHTGNLAAEMYVAGGTAQAFQQRLASQVTHQVRLATVISKTLVNLPQASLFAARVWPGALRAIALHTRIQSQKLLT